MKKVLISTLLMAPLFTSAVTAELMVDTGRESVNALEATIQMPNGVSVETVHDGQSAILIWVNKPTLDSSTNRITFSGITPGGFSGMVSVLSLTGEMSVADFDSIIVSNITALRNDGTASTVPVQFKWRETALEEDLEAPEIFKPVVAQSDNSFEGRYFLTYTTRDKQSGIDHYEVSYAWPFKFGEGEWIQAESPLVLLGHQLFKRIYVRAIDQVGNQRVVSTVGPYYYLPFLIGAIIMICVLLYSRRSLSYF